MRYDPIAAPSDELAIARLLRADPAEVRAYAAGLSDERRAHLALFCHARTHFRDLGLLLARECTRYALANAGGFAGEFLADQVTRGAPGEDAPPQRRRAGISLARGGTSVVTQVRSATETTLPS